jgi:uncharacterized protein
MRINVLNELRQPVGAVTVFDLAEPARRLEDTDLSSLSGTLHLVRTNRGLLATLRATAAVSEQCARCLAPTRCSVPIEFEEEFIPVLDANTARRVRVVNSDDGFRIGPDFMLDLGEPVRQYMLMLEPQKPLCRPDCSGLCPACGADLNIASCGCAPSSDERWGVLAGFDPNKKKGP